MQQDPFQRELGNPTIEDPTDHGAEIYCIDIDGTLTYPHIGTPWDAKPRLDRIAVVNEMFDNGAIIYLQTARGWISSKGNAQEADRLMRPMTEEQLKEWGVKYTSLHFGKPRARIYVDDRAVSDKEFFERKAVDDYVKQIDEQSKKPLKEQIADVKQAAAKFFVAVDKIISDL